MTSVAGEGPPRADIRALFGRGGRGVLIINDALLGTLTCVLPGAPAREAGQPTEPLTVRVPTSPAAARAVEREAQLLVELRRRRLGPIEKTIPRHVGVRHLDGLPVAMASLVPGRPMSADYDRWIHVARPDLVRRDFHWASDWLAGFQEASATGVARSTWVAEVIEALCDRVGPGPLLATGLANLAPAADRLDGQLIDQSAVHGDFSHGNLLVDHAEVSGVVNWVSGEAEGWPLRDLARFALRYSQHLDQNARPGGRVAGHAGLRRVGVAPGIRFALQGRGWYPRTVRTYLQGGLDRLGLPPHLWYDVALVGIAEMAAQEQDDHAVGDLLTLLCSLPPHP